MVKRSKVFCCVCKYLCTKKDESAFEVGYRLGLSKEDFECHHPNNLKPHEDWYGKYDFPIRKAESINLNNDCPWYERIF